MKLLHRVNLFVLLTFLTTSFKSDSDKEFLLKDNFRFIPEGKLIVRDSIIEMHSFYMFETEISNKEYQAFLASLKEKEGILNNYLIAKVDSSAWSKILPNPTSFIVYYHRDSQYEDFPVVNISHRAAELYCNWLTAKYNKEGFNILVRLPTRNEWIYAAKGGNEKAVYSNTKNLTSDEKYDYINFKVGRSCDGKVDSGGLMIRIRTGIPNKFGLYNMCGNVAEMLKDGGTKGGSYRSDAEHVKIEAEDEYANINEPMPFIGFRPVAIIKK